MKTLRTSLFAALGLSALAGVAGANAFNINEHDPRVTGRGGATAASNDGPSSIVFNPGGIAISEGTNVAIGSAIYIAEGTYQPEGGEKTKTDSSPSVVPSFYITSRVHDMLAVGVGFHLPFGLAVSWPDSHAQRDIVMDQNLRTYFITPTVGLNLKKQVPGLSLGVGADIVPATIELEQDILFGDPGSPECTVGEDGCALGNALLAGDTIGFGVRAGVMYHPPAVKGLKVGVMYRSPIKLKFEGTGDFDIADPFRSQLPPDGAITAEITLPQTVWGGIAYSPVKNLEVEVNAVWIDWSETFENGDLTINFTDAMVSTAQPQDYEDKVSYRFGVDYYLEAQKLGLRAGFVYDPTPIPSRTLTARLPDIDRKNITLGASKQFGNYGAHLGMLWVTPGKRDTDTADPYSPQFKAEYGVQAFVVSLGVSAKFGGETNASASATGGATVSKK
jgi:long-chain fatty acid transport protein